MKMSFEDWMGRVDYEVSRMVGLSAHDLSDQPWHDWWMDGVRPKTAAKRAIKADGGGMLL